MKATIIPTTDPLYDQLKPARLTWTYLHGKLEEDCDYDCYGIVEHNFPTDPNESRRIDHSKMEDGKYPMKYNDKNCTLYFWHSKDQRPHGLVVYDDDKKSIKYAQKCLLEKPYCI